MIAEQVARLVLEIEDASDLLDANEWLWQGPAFNAGLLRRFAYLHARDQLALILSERDSRGTSAARSSPRSACALMRRERPNEHRNCPG